MLDLIYVGTIVAFFAVTAALIPLFVRLRGKKGRS
jgi:hypothetical protein